MDEYCLDRYEQVKYFIESLIERNKKLFDDSTACIGANQWRKISKIDEFTGQSSTEEKKKIKGILKAINKQAASK